MAESAGDLAGLLELARDLALEAGGLLRRAAGADGSGRRLDATAKSSRSDLVTATDRASERLIAERLAKARPDDGLLAEEGSSRPGSSGLTWVVDPLDGTTNFVYGYPPFAVSIACTDGRGEALVGVVHDPVRGETFSALRGGGARLDDRELRCPEPPSIGEALVGTGFGYTPERRTAQARLLPQVVPAVRDIRRGGSAALDLCFVAAGRLDAFYEAGLQPWDRAAGLLIATEAGAAAGELEGVVADVPTLVVAAEPLRAELVGLLRESAAAGPAAGASPRPAGRPG